MVHLNIFIWICILVRLFCAYFNIRELLKRDDSLNCIYYYSSVMLWFHRLHCNANVTCDHLFIHKKYSLDLNAPHLIHTFSYVLCALKHKDNSFDHILMLTTKLSWGVQSNKHLHKFLVPCILFWIVIISQPNKL